MFVGFPYIVSGLSTLISEHAILASGTATTDTLTAKGPQGKYHAFKFQLKT